LRDNTVKCGILVTKPLFTSAEGTEILSSVWDDIVIKLEVDTTGARLDVIIFTNGLALLVALKQWTIPGDVEVTVENHFDLGI
jgi:hypothetical protein